MTGKPDSKLEKRANQTSLFLSLNPAYAALEARQRKLNTPKVIRPDVIAAQKRVRAGK